MISKVLLSHRDLAGVHFTGSTDVFNSMWRTIGANMSNYRSYPRIVGETGGKDFIVAHPSADPQAFAVAIVRGGFEYQGQKCSAAAASTSRSRSGRTSGSRRRDDRRDQDGRRPRLPQLHGRGHRQEGVREHQRYIDPTRAKTRRSSPAGSATTGRATSSARRSSRPRTRGTGCMCEEIFGPVVTVYVYDDDKWMDDAGLVDSTSPYALTGAVFSQDRAAVREAMSACATPPATSTSTTSRPAPSSGSSRSAARARRARTTRPAPS